MSITNSWSVSKRGELLLGSRVFLSDLVSRIEFADGSVVTGAVSAAEKSREAWVHKFGGITISHAWEKSDRWFRVRTIIRNDGQSAVNIRSVEPFSGVLGLEWDRIFSQSETMTKKVGIFEFQGSFESHMCVALSGSNDEEGLLAGFEYLGDSFYRFSVDADVRRITPVCPREDIALEPGAELEISPLLIGVGQGMSALFSEYAKVTGQRLAARVSSETTSGWCSWYHYYGSETEDDILENARVLKSSPLGELIKVIQIDEGWNRSRVDAQRVWGDWQPGGKFPMGMKRLADEIHALDFQAGLWLAPFSADPGSTLVAEHPDWLIQTKSRQGGLLDAGGLAEVKGLDLTNPEVLNWLEETFNRVFHEWGFDYVKIDFLMHAVLEGNRFDPTKTTAEAFRMGMEVIRRCAGEEKFVLACGSPLGPAIGLCDAMRIGPDVGGRWHSPINLAEWPQGNCCIRAAAYPTFYRHWMHEHWWQNDPDCLLARDGSVSYEIAAFEHIKAELPTTGLGISKEDFGLTLNEAEFWVRAVWFTGGLSVLSEVWNSLQPERQNLLQQAFVPHRQKVGLENCFRDPAMAVLRSMSGRAMIGLFNLSDDSKSVRIPENASKNESYREWLSGEIISVREGRFPSLPPRSARIWIEFPE